MVDKGVPELLYGSLITSMHSETPDGSNACKGQRPVGDGQAVQT